MKRNTNIPVALFLIMLLWLGGVPTPTLVKAVSPVKIRQYAVTGKTVTAVSVDANGLESETKVAIGQQGQVETFFIEIENISTAQVKNVVLVETGALFNDVEFLSGSIKIGADPVSDSTVPTENDSALTRHTAHYVQDDNALRIGIGTLQVGDIVTVSFEGRCLNSGSYLRANGYHNSLGTSPGGVHGSSSLPSGRHYNITYHANNGTAVDYVMPRERVGITQTVLDNSDLTQPFTNSGYSFLGWSTNKNDSTPEYSAGDLIGDASRIYYETNLYAIWGSTGATTYTVTYDANTGTGTVPTDPTSYSSGAEVTVLDGNQLSKSGYRFNGWNTEANGSGTRYNVGAKFNIAANTVLYAQWSDNSSTGGGGGGTTPPSSTEAPPEATTTESEPEVTTEEEPSTTDPSDVEISDIDDPKNTSETKKPSIKKPLPNSKTPKSSTPNKFNNRPNTGDQSNLILPVSTILLAGITLVILHRRRNKNYN